MAPHHKSNIIYKIPVEVALSGIRTSVHQKSLVVVGRCWLVLITIVCSFCMNTMHEFF